MASDLPTNFDVIVVGTGMPESILAAAFARVGQQVLHIDKNDYYSGQWASFNLEGIEKWTRRAMGEDQLKHPDIDAGSLLKDGEHLVQISLFDDNYSNISLNFHARDDTIELEQESEKSENGEQNIEHSQPECPEQETQSESKHNEQESETGSSQKTDSDPVVKQEAEGVCNDNSEKLTTEKHDGESIVKQEGPADSIDESIVKQEGPADSIDESIVKQEGPADSIDESIVKQEGPADSIDESIVKQEGSTDDSSEQNKSEGNNDKKTEDISHQVGATSDKTTEQKSTSDEQCLKEWTKSSLKKEWRKFNLDLAPRLLYCRGSMVELLITSDIAKYCEFKTVTRMLTLLNGKLEKVPCSRADVFSSKDVSMLEKRMLMKFLTFCNDFQNQPQEWTEYKERPFVEYLTHKKLTSNIKHFIQHSIAMVTDDISTEEGLSRTQKFLHSLGRYGNTSFLWSLYGSGEMPQSFCRMCAVFGGIYCLRMSASSLIVDKDNRCCGIITTEGQRIDCRWLIMEHSSAPKQFLQKKETRSLSRAILITDRSILLSDSQEELLCTLVRKDPSLYGLSAGTAIRSLSELCELSLLRLPDPDGGQPITVLELPSSSMACPPGLCVVQISREGTDITVEPQEDLSFAIQTLFNGEENKDENKANILWSLFYNQVICDEVECSQEAPDNVLVVSGTGSEIDMDRPVTEAKKIFEKLMPDEDFLPRPPNPEDIIYVDEAEATVGGENTSQSDFSGSGDAQSGLTEQKTSDQSQDSTQKGTDQSQESVQKDNDQLEQNNSESDQSNELKQDTIDNQTDKTHDPS